MFKFLCSSGTGLPLSQQTFPHLPVFPARTENRECSRICMLPHSSKVKEKGSRWLRHPAWGREKGWTNCCANVFYFPIFRKKILSCNHYKPYHDHNSCLGGCSSSHGPDRGEVLHIDYSANPI